MSSLGRRLALVAAALASACISISPPVSPRYFTPTGSGDAFARVSNESSVVRLPLRLRRVRAAAHLKERMVWRRSDVEFGFHELLRWTQPPHRFVEQAVSAELFERRGFRRADSGAATLAVELRSFDELLGQDHAAVVELSVLLTDARRVSLLERTIAVRHPVEGRDPGAVARAMGIALEQAVRELADGVERALGG